MKFNQFHGITIIGRLAVYAWFGGLFDSAVVLADPPEGGPLVYSVDPRPIGKTPRYLGVNVEVMDFADRCNLWDWLADSGASMVRVFHPDMDLRKSMAMADSYSNIVTRGDFDAFRKRLLADPDNHLPWQNYRFTEHIPWLGVPDAIVGKLQQIGIYPILGMAYAPKYFPRPLLKNWTDHVVPPDEQVDWAAAASAYEYYFAMIYRYASRNGVVYFQMLNEPSGDKEMIQQVGVLARLARLAMEDARGKLKVQQTASSLKLTGPAFYMFWAEYWPYIDPYVDHLDVHLYDPEADIFARKMARALTQARLSGKRLAVSEFNRVGGPMPPEQSLFSMQSSLEAAGLVMSVLSASPPEDSGCEFALFYQFQFPATHRNFKSMVYGDMNLIDWTGRDMALRDVLKPGAPDFEQLQLRFATPTYHLFKMFGRCAPGGGNVDGYEVFDLGEGNRGVSAVRDPANGRNVYPKLEPQKYYASGGGGSELHGFGVKSRDRFYVMMLNPGPTTVSNVSFDLRALKENYATAVVRETTLRFRDQATQQRPVTDDKVSVNISPESVTQIIFTREDLAKITDLKIEEKTMTPGSSVALGQLQTTRMRALGRINGYWLDMTDLNVVWTSSAPNRVKVYQGGLVQNLGKEAGESIITAKTFNGVSANKIVNCAN